MPIKNFERWRGELVMRTPQEMQAKIAFEKAKDTLLGKQVGIKTRRGTRAHVCTVIAVPDPECHLRWPRRRVFRVTGLKITASYEATPGRPHLDKAWSSAIARERYINSPLGHRTGHGYYVLRIDQSTAPNMVGRYLYR